MAPLHAVLRKFRARDSWESYSRELEQYFKVNSVSNDNERVAVLLTVLSPSVYKVLRNSCYPELPRLKTYAELSELMKTHHSPQPSVFKQRVEFYRATQDPTESVNEWLGRVTRLAAACDFGNQFVTTLKDNFVSGLANQRVVRRLCEEKSSATLVDLADMVEKYALLCGTESSILDLPDEVLVQIILLLTARERILLGESCQRLKTLVFEDPRLLRYLDFSKKAHLTTMTHIQQYFDTEKSCQHILKINARCVQCLKPGDLLNRSIGKAINLVEINIHGTQFEDIWQLGSFLQPLNHLVKLSIDWPKTVENDNNLCRQILQRPFSKLTYLSAYLSNSNLAMFTDSLSLCQQLEKLRMMTWYLEFGLESNFSNTEIKHLTNLKIVQYHGPKAITIKQELAKVLPDPGRWMDFQLCGPVNHAGFYIEKEVEVCEGLLQSERLQDFLNPAPWANFNLGWAVSPAGLLKEVLRITHEDVPDDLCCLSAPVGEREPHLLKVEHAKMLLKDPRCQIPYLYLNHRLESDCDAHLLASAFPNLSELVLSAITWNLQTPPKDPHYRRRLRSKCVPVPEGQDDSSNQDSSFKMLVENTPNLRHFTLMPVMWSTDDPASDALHLIPAWKSLESLNIHGGLDIEDGQFLIEIGKECKNLQTFYLSLLKRDRACLYEDALFQMLEHSKKLRNFTIRQSHVDQVKIFDLLAENVDLERVCAKEKMSMGKNSVADWIQSLTNLIRQCQKLTVVIAEITVKSENDYKEAESAVRRLEGEFRGRDLEILAIFWIPMPGEADERAEVWFEMSRSRFYEDTPERKIFY